MRRRIALANFLTVALTLMACGTIAYWIVRSVLLADLDASIVARASSLPQLVDETGSHSHRDHPLEPTDRYVIRTDDNQTIVTAPGIGTTNIQFLNGKFDQMDGRRCRTVTFRAVAQPAEDQTPVPATVTFTASAEQFFRLLNRLMVVLIATGLGGCIIAAVFVWRIAGTSLRPLTTTADVIGTIDESSLDQRIATANLPPELQPVATTLNQMLASLEKSFQRRKEFLADAAHELRTPVAALLTGLEVSLRQQRDADSYKHTLGICLSDARHLRHLVDALMRQARGESASRDTAHWLDPAEIVNQCADIAAALGSARGVRVIRDLQPGLRMLVEEARLRSAAMNLLGNAVEYNRDNGTVHVSLMREGDETVIEIADTGRGIPAANLEKIFQPFFRADGARKSDDHLGLGLFLVQTHCRAMNGKCTVHSVEGEGTRFTMRLRDAAVDETQRAATRTAQLAPSAAPGLEE